MENKSSITEEMRNYKILIEIPCFECDGEGKTLDLNKERVICSDCDGTGYTHSRISLGALKLLLNGGTL